MACPEEIHGYSEEKLRSNNEKFYSVLNHLEFLSEKRSCNRLSRILLINQTNFELKYNNCGNYSGWFFNKVRNAFDEEAKITPGNVGGILCTKTSDTACGASGFISVKVQTHIDNYMVFCGFNTGYHYSSSAGVEIRKMENGVFYNEIKIHDLMTKVRHPDGNGLLHIFTEDCECFKVEVQFTDKESFNERWNNFIFTFKQ